MRAAILVLLAAAPLVHASAAITSLPPQTRSVAELAAALDSAEPAARASAACALRKQGDAAIDAVPRLIALLADPSPVDRTVCDQRWGRESEHQTTPGEEAARTLVAVGTRAFDPLIGALASNAWIARRNAAWALGALDDPRAVPPLQTALRDREPGVREQAAWALGAIDSREAVPALLTALEDADSRVRQQAAWALGAIDDPRALDGLVRALSDQEKGVREQAAWALGAIGDARALPGLLPILRDPEPAVRRQAAWAIGVIGR